MLQRAASNAYSWWWASHIRTKQSKWLEQNLQDMGEKVTEVLKLIEEDGDSFAKRAEMYYKKRPELISFVEESYRAYRSLAERYDHISTELQNANSTIASVFPEQVQFAMDEDEEAGMAARMPKRPSYLAPGTNIPKVPDVQPKDLKGLLKSTANKLRPKTRTKSMSVAPPTSGLSKNEALKEIDRLQKGILTLQTEKEFKKVSYESSLAKYWEIEAQIREMHDKICRLQDEFGISSVIEDDEARSLMATAALQSCQDTLALLQGKQERSAEEARVENRRIRDAKHKLESLREGHHLPDQSGQGEEMNYKNESVEVDDEMQNSTTDQDAVRELELLREKIKEQLNAGASSSLTVTEMAEKVDELVTKVVSLESAVSSQTALISRLRTENDDLLTQIRSLEGVRTSTADGTINLSSKLQDVEKKLQGIQDLSQNIQDQNNNLQTHFTEAHCNLDHLTEKLPGVEISVNYDSLGKKDEGLAPGGVESQMTIKQEGDSTNSSESATLDEQLHATSSLEKQEGSMNVENLPKAVDDVSIQEMEEQRECGLPQDDGQLSPIASEDREKVLLDKYTSILRDFKEVKKKLGETEKNHQDSASETAGQLRELRSANAKKDEEIQSLRHRLTMLLQKKTTQEKNNKDLMMEVKNSSRQQSSSNLLDNHQPAQLEATMENSDAPTETGNNYMEEDEDEDEDDIDVLLMDLPHTASPIEEKFRMNIDELLEQNLDFWLRFSSSFHQIQKFQTGIEDLQSEISKLKGKLGEKQQEGSKTVAAPSLKSDARPIYKHLREIQTELTVWLEQSVLLKDELQCRFSALCRIQEEIAKALKEGAYEHESNKLTGYQAAKFQGEVMNMQQENNKVADELQAGLDHITGLQFEVDRTLAKLNEEFKLSGSKNQNSTPMRSSSGRTRVPLRSFIFGAKPKKQKPSIFACVNPVLQRKYNDIRAGLPMNSRSNGNNRKKD